MASNLSAPPVLTVEEAIEEADRLPLVATADALARMSVVDRLEARRLNSDREDLRRAVLAGHIQGRYVDDDRCGQSWTVLAYVEHSGRVKHAPGEVVVVPAEVDERGLGRAGESKTAAHR